MLLNQMKAIIITLFLFFIPNIYANAQFKALTNWVKKEVLPTITGQRPLKIDMNRVEIKRNGESVFKLEPNALYVRFGDITFQTGDLQKDMARAGAIFSGNTAVLAQTISEELMRKLEKAQSEGKLSLSDSPPSQTLQESERNQSPAFIKQEENVNLSGGRYVVLFNQTPVTIRYALNGQVYELGSNKGYNHFSPTSEFFLQFDDNMSDVFSISRYYLTGNIYGLTLSTDATKINIQRYEGK